MQHHGRFGHILDRPLSAIVHFPTHPELLPELAHHHTQEDLAAVIVN
jgi:hypothetical protein